MVVQGLTRRLSKLEAAKELEVSPTTVDRMIARGELQTEQEPRGTRYKVWVLLPDDEPLAPSGSPVEQSGDESEDKSRDAPSLAKGESGMEELIRLRLQVKNIEDLATYRGERAAQNEAVRPPREQKPRRSLAMEKERETGATVGQSEEPGSGHPGTEPRAQAGGEAAAELVAMEKERRNALSAAMRPLEMLAPGARGGFQ